MFSQNAGNAISETQILKIFQGSMPLEISRLRRSFRHWLAPPQKNFAGSTTDQILRLSFTFLNITFIIIIYYKPESSKQV
jgi:hypothetical protein